MKLFKAIIISLSVVCFASVKRFNKLYSFQ